MSRVNASSEVFTSTVEADQNYTFFSVYQAPAGVCKAGDTA